MDPISIFPSLIRCENSVISWAKSFSGNKIKSAQMSVYWNLLGLLFDFRDIYNTKPYDYDQLIKSKEHAKRERVCLGTFQIVTDYRESILQQITQLKDDVQTEINRLSN